MNTAGLLVPPMRGRGYMHDAERVMTSLEMSVERSGYREYCKPLTGLGARGFGCATLLIDLLARCGLDPREPSASQRMMAP